MQKYILIAAIIFEVLLCGSIIVAVYRRTAMSVSHAYQLSIVTLHRNWFTQRNDVLPGYYEPIAFNRMTQNPSSWMKDPVTYRINGDTLHDRFDYTTEKSPDTFRIVTLGDSFTVGLYVNTEENWSERLEDMIKPSEVINLGVPGYDIAFAAVRYMDRGKKYHPDLIIWYLTGNSFVKRASLVFTENPNVVARLEQQGLKGKALLSAVNRAVIDDVNRLYGGEDAVVSYQMQQFQSLLAATKGIKILVLLDQSVRDPDIKQRVREIVTQYPRVAVHNMPVIDVLPDTHPSPLGHRQIAFYIYTYLRQSGVMPDRTP